MQANIEPKQFEVGLRAIFPSSSQAKDVGVSALVHSVQEAPFLQG